MHAQFTLQEFKVNGITVHGWPGLRYSWRHRIKPAAQAG